MDKRRGQKKQPRIEAKPSPQQPGVWLKTSGISIGIGLAALILICCFFCPRFFFWPALEIPEARDGPELNRAYDTLRQLDDPFVRIENPNNSVIQWRLLMPMLAHYTHMPWWCFLALPAVGCVIVLAVIARMVHTTSGSWAKASMAAVILGACPWLFVSTGWLAYFDSWLVLAMIAGSFARSRRALFLAFFLGLWVDERIVVAAPVCLLVRLLYLRWEGPQRWKQTLYDGLTIAATIAPYVAIRLLLIAGKDKSSAGYIATTIIGLRQVHWTRFVRGLWSGYRLAWSLIIAACAIAWTRRGRAAGALAIVLVALTAGVSLVIAADLSRSLQVLIPLALLGLVWLWKFAPRLSRVALPALLLAQLLLPAEHVVATFISPIKSLPMVLYACKHPPPDVDLDAYLAKADAAIVANNLDLAMHEIDNALKLDSHAAGPHTRLAAVCLRTGNMQFALQSANTALQLEPASPDALYMRGIIEEQMGDVGAARRDMSAALVAAKQDWSGRAACQRNLARLNASNQPGIP
jgi:tetratricopeptide (TPR) repeat protein